MFVVHGQCNKAVAAAAAVAREVGDVLASAMQVSRSGCFAALVVQG